MNIQKEPLSNIKYSDIELFVKQRVIEGVNLEYKSDIPRDLAKQFVTFSNTQGGMILIGVSEDEKGAPKEAAGIENDGKLIDRIHQIAGNVLPLPNYEVDTTDEKDGKVVLLIRVYEGTSPLYATNNDPTPWIRTGNVSKPLQAANREELNLLLQKREVSKQLRDSAVEYAHLNLKEDIEIAESERKLLLAQSEHTDDNIYSHRLGPGKYAALFSMSFIPHHPLKEIFSLDDLSDNLQIVLGKHYVTSSLYNGKSIPGGIDAFEWSKSFGYISNTQLYTNGQIFTSEDLVRPQEDAPKLSAYAINSKIHEQIDLARQVYGEANYHGQVEISIRLEGGKGTIVLPPRDRMVFSDSYGMLKFNNYDWSFSTDSMSLQSDSGAADLHKNMMRQVCWSIGLGKVNDENLEYLFSLNRWYGHQSQG